MSLRPASPAVMAPKKPAAPPPIMISWCVLSWSDMGGSKSEIYGSAILDLVLKMGS